MRTFWGAGLLCCPPHPHTHRGSPTTETAAGFRLRPHSYGTGREAGERPPGPALARNAQDQTRGPEAQRVWGAHASPTTHTRGLAEALSRKLQVQELVPPCPVRVLVSKASVGRRQP